jgi:segregation and condensation protein B
MNKDEQSKFELASDHTSSPEESAKALAEHQMEAMEELPTHATFDLIPGEEETTKLENLEELPLIIEDEEAKKIVETLLFASKEPLRPRDISVLFRGVENIDAKKIRKILLELVDEYKDKTFQIVEIAEGFQIRTRSEFHPWVRKLLRKEKSKKLSQAALETLAIISYKQPITRIEVEEIRRVDCSGVMNTLLEKNIIKIMGRKDVLGKPIVYGTTPLFLKHFGFKSISDMPNPEEYLSEIGLEQNLQSINVMDTNGDKNDNQNN